MASTFGEKLKISIFGQSHGEAIGVVIDGFPAGVKIDAEKLSAFMARRAPGGAHATPRKEKDEVRFLSGVVDGTTCGAPICAIIENTNTRSGDYKELFDVPRPGHADFAAQVKFGGYQDVRGGGHFSGRLTAPLCIAGALCMQLLEEKGVSVFAHNYSIAGVKDAPFDPVNPKKALCGGELCVINEESGERMLSAIEEARREGDSVGGVIECAITGVPAGVGSPMFDGVENRIASVVFGVPAVKGVEFGLGFAAADVRGSENNDPFFIDGGVKTKTNNHGGSLGGITSGMPIIFRAAIKPTPSIAKEQDSVSLSEGKECKLSVKGRHDPCIAVRAVPVIEAAAAVAVCDMLLSEGRF